jgi:hypothetical protein
MYVRGLYARSKPFRFIEVDDDSLISTFSHLTGADCFRTGGSPLGHEALVVNVLRLRGFPEETQRAINQKRFIGYGALPGCTHLLDHFRGVGTISIAVDHPLSTTAADRSLYDTLFRTKLRTPALLKRLYDRVIASLPVGHTAEALINEFDDDDHKDVPKSPTKPPCHVEGRRPQLAFCEEEEKRLLDVDVEGPPIVSTIGHTMTTLGSCPARPPMLSTHGGECIITARTVHSASAQSTRRRQIATHFALNRMCEDDDSDDSDSDDEDEGPFGHFRRHRLPHTWHMLGTIVLAANPQPRHAAFILGNDITVPKIADVPAHERHNFCVIDKIIPGRYASLLQAKYGYNLAYARHVSTASHHPLLRADRAAMRHAIYMRCAALNLPIVNIGGNAADAARQMARLRQRNGNRLRIHCCSPDLVPGDADRHANWNPARHSFCTCTFDDHLNGGCERCFGYLNGECVYVLVHVYQFPENRTCLLDSILLACAAGSPVFAGYHTFPHKCGHLLEADYYKKGDFVTMTVAGNDIAYRHKDSAWSREMQYSRRLDGEMLRMSWHHTVHEHISTVTEFRRRDTLLPVLSRQNMMSKITHVRKTQIVVPDFDLPISPPWLEIVAQRAAVASFGQDPKNWSRNAKREFNQAVRLRSSDDISARSDPRDEVGDFKMLTDADQRMLRIIYATSEKVAFQNNFNAEARVMYDLRTEDVRTDCLRRVLSCCYKDELRKTAARHAVRNHRGWHSAKRTLASLLIPCSVLLILIGVYCSIVVVSHGTFFNPTRGRLHHPKGSVPATPRRRLFEVNMKVLDGFLGVRSIITIILFSLYLWYVRFSVVKFIYTTYDRNAITGACMGLSRKLKPMRDAIYSFPSTALGRCTIFKPVMFAQGPVARSVRGQVPAKCDHNTHVSISNRIMADKRSWPKYAPDNNRIAEFCKWTRANMHTIFPIHNGRYMPLSDKAFLERYTGARRTVYTKAMEALQHMAHNKDTLKRLARVKMFVKREASCKVMPNEIDPKRGDHDPRAIQAASPEYNCLTGPIIQGFYKYISDTWCTANDSPIIYSSGLTAEGVGSWFDWAVDQVLNIASSVSFIMSDYSRYDMTVDPWMLDLQYEIVIHCMNLSPWQVSILRSMRDPTGTSSGGFYYKVKGERRSGLCDTSVGNSVLTGLFQLFSFCHVRGISNLSDVPFRVIVNGDDSLLVMDKNSVPDFISEKTQSKLGLITKVEVVEQEAAEFCSAFFCPTSNGTVLTKKFGRNLARTFYSEQDYGVVKSRSYVHQISQAMLRDYWHVEPARLFFERMLTLTEPLPNRRNRRLRNRRLNRMLSYAVHSEINNEASDETRAFLKARYGYDDTLLESWRQYVAGINDYKILVDHPLLDLFLKVDWGIDDAELDIARTTGDNRLSHDLALHGGRITVVVV